MRHTRGFIASWMRLIAPPLPAASRPSNTTTTRSPSSLMYSWSLTNSSWSLASSASYEERLILPVLSRFELAASLADGLVRRRSALRHPDVGLPLGLAFSLVLGLVVGLALRFRPSFTPRHPSAIGTPGIISFH